MTLIADDPAVRCMERTGYPPWMVYGGKNDEEEQETEHLIYRVCKRTIRRGGYPADMQTRLDVFYAGGKLSTEEYDELCGMLEAE